MVESDKVTPDIPSLTTTESSPVETLPAHTRAQVRFDVDYPDMAGYDIVTNDLVVGPRSCVYSEAVIEAFLRHERTHEALYALPAEEQERLARTFVDDHFNLLIAYYHLLRQGHYDPYYFSMKRAEKNRDLRVNIGKKPLGTVPVTFTYRGKDVRVDALSVFDELVAYHNTDIPYTDRVIDDDFTLKLHQSAVGILSRTDPVLQASLRDQGLFSIDTSGDLNTLFDDPRFVAIRGRKLVSQIAQKAVYMPIYVSRPKETAPQPLPTSFSL